MNIKTTLKDEWRVLKMHVELEIKGDGSAIRSRKTPTNRNHSITYYNYKIKNDRKQVQIEKLTKLLKKLSENLHISK